MSLKDSALAVLQRNHERNKGATSDKKTMQLNTHLQANKVASNRSHTQFGVPRNNLLEAYVTH